MDLACCELTAPIIERREVSSLWEDLTYWVLTIAHSSSVSNET